MLGIEKFSEIENVSPKEFIIKSNNLVRIKIEIDTKRIMEIFTAKYEAIEFLCIQTIIY